MPATSVRCRDVMVISTGTIALHHGSHMLYIPRLHTLSYALHPTHSDLYMQALAPGIGVAVHTDLCQLCCSQCHPWLCQQLVSCVGLADGPPASGCRHPSAACLLQSPLPWRPAVFCTRTLQCGGQTAEKIWRSRQLAQQHHKLPDGGRPKLVVKLLPGQQAFL